LNVFKSTSDAPEPAGSAAPAEAVAAPPKAAVKTTKTAKGEDTRARVFDTALRLFREKGFDATTMRDVAAEAGLSLGAAYHYFASKDAIIAAYYESVQSEHVSRLRKALPERTSSRDRLGYALHTKLDILRNDRPLMGALLRYTGDAKHPLSFLGEGTRAIQFGSMALFAEALDWEQLPKDMREIIPLMAWAMHMGLLLYFLYDESPNQTRTARLTDGAADLFAKWLTLVKLPVLRPLRKRVISLLTDAGLVPDEAALAPHRMSAVQS
jgi:AcrR family transcriptional regulator